VLADRGQHFIPVRFRHLDIEQDDIGFQFSMEVDGGEAVSRAYGAQPLAYEVSIEDASDFRVILCD